MLQVQEVHKLVTRTMAPSTELRSSIGSGDDLVHAEVSMLSIYNRFVSQALVKPNSKKGLFLHKRCATLFECSNELQHGCALVSEGLDQENDPIVRAVVTGPGTNRRSQGDCSAAALTN